MTGKYTIEIGTKEFLEGMTSSPETEDGGFSPQSSNLNLNATPITTGVLYSAASIVDKSTNLNGNIIATCSDPDSGIGTFRYLLTSTGRFISCDSNSDLTVRQTGASTYQSYFSDMTVYRNELYATSLTNITKASGATLGTISETWGSATSGIGALTTSRPHPLLVYQDNLFIGDDNKVHRWDGLNTTGTPGYLKLNTGVIVQAMSIDPGTGLMMISTTDGINASDTAPRQGKVYLWNGSDATPQKEVFVDDMVTSMHVIGGTVFMCYGQNIGYWNGAGITFLRKLKRVLLNNDYLVFKHKITNIGKTLYIADGIDIIAFDEMVSGKKRWYVAKTVSESFYNYISAVFYVGDNKIGIGYDSSGSAPKFATFDRTSLTTGGFNFYSRKYTFPRPIYIRELHIEYLDAVATTATSGVVTFYDQNLSVIVGPTLTNDSTSSTYSITRPLNYKNKIRTLQMFYTNSSYTSIIAGIRRFVISYDVAE